MKDDTFQFLVFGLAKYLDGNSRYPLPDELQYALNHLSHAMGTSFPRTFSGLLNLMNNPLSTWWPSSLSEPEISMEDALIYDGDLSPAANEFFDELLWEADIPPGTSIERFQLALDKLHFKKMIKKLKQLSTQTPESAQAEYVALRRFMISTPWATTRQLVAYFGEFQHLSVEEVGDLYEDADALQSRYLYSGYYWNCPLCGPLTVKRNERRTIKSSVCGNRCPGPSNWQSIEPRRQLRVLKYAHQLSVLIPGIPELDLYDWLVEQSNKASSQIRHVELWPGIDSYDFRIHFTDDEIWAIDVKDYTDPFRLETRVTGFPRYEGLEWDRAFYVFPTYRLHQRSRYSEVIASIQRKLPRSIDIHDTEAFKGVISRRKEGS